jgi:hypothetical protein
LGFFKKNIVFFEKIVALHKKGRGNLLFSREDQKKIFLHCNIILLQAMMIWGCNSFLESPCMQSTFDLWPITIRLYVAPQQKRIL